MALVYKVQVSLDGENWYDAFLPILEYRGDPLRGERHHRVDVDTTAEAYNELEQFTNDSYLVGFAAWNPNDTSSYRVMPPWTRENAPFLQPLDVTGGHTYYLKFPNGKICSGNKTSTGTGDNYSALRDQTVTPHKNVLGLVSDLSPSGAYNNTATYQASIGFVMYDGGELTTDSNIIVGRFIIGEPSKTNFIKRVVYYKGDVLSGIPLAEYLEGVEPETPFYPDGPYDPGGNSGEGDLPPGTFDDTSDIIPDSSLPSISAADTGFTRIYNPTLAQVQSLARYLWTDDTVLDTIWNHIKQFFEDPMQAIIGFNLVPCRVPDGGTRSFALMYIDTGVQMTAAASQFVDVDCGTVAVERYYGAALDQNPYTKISCFLPFIGTVHLDTDEVMGETLHIKYRIDIVSGSCVAKIFKIVGNQDSILYQYSGHCAITVPISSADFAAYVSAAISVGSVAAGLAIGGAAGIGVGAAESEALTVTSAEMSAPITASEASALIAGDGGTGVATGASFNGINAANITNTVGQVMGSKLQIEHSGSFSGNSGYLGIRVPYLIIERPNQCLPTTYGHLNGYPCMISLNLSECSGFTKVQQVQLTGVTATNPEQSEILQFLKSGVYL